MGRRFACSAILTGMTFPPALTPCTGVCTIGEDGLCLGCRRTRDEIARWPGMGSDERLRLMRDELPQRLHRVLPEQESLQRALHPLSEVPLGDGWNFAELSDLVVPGPLQDATVLVGLVPRDSGTRVVLTRRNEHLRNHAGQVSFPGGRIDAGDAGVVAAALRETGEEIGVVPPQVVPLGFLDPFVTTSRFRVVPVVATLDPAYVARPNPGEVAEVFEVPLDYLMSPQHLRDVFAEFRGRRRRVLEYDWPGQRIWGATAAILFNLRQRLEHPA